MTWLDLYTSIEERLIPQPPKMNQQEVADRLGVDPKPGCQPGY